MTSRAVSFAWSSSDCDLSFGLPEALRRRAARRARMLGAEVSGRKKRSEMKMGAASHNISHCAQCQFLAGTLKPEIRGPRAGPAVANDAHPVRK